MAATFLGPNIAGPDLPRTTTSGPTASSRTTGSSCPRSTDGGLTWGQPVAVVSHTFTGTPGTLGTTGPAARRSPSMSTPLSPSTPTRRCPTASPTPTTATSTSTWVRVYPAGQFPGDPNSTDGTDIMFSVSTDGGQTWTTQLQTQPAPGEPGNVQVSVIQRPGLRHQRHRGTRARGIRLSTRRSRSVRKATSTSPRTSGGYFSVFHSSDGGASFVAPNLHRPGWALPSPRPRAPDGDAVRRRLPHPLGPRHRRRPEPSRPGLRRRGRRRMTRRQERPDLHARRSSSPIRTTTARPGRPVPGRQRDDEPGEPAPRRSTTRSCRS